MFRPIECEPLQQLQRKFQNCYVIFCSDYRGQFYQYNTFWVAEWIIRSYD